MLAGVVPYIPFKSNTVQPRFDDKSAWRKCSIFPLQTAQEFWTYYYHQQSNVETLFSHDQGEVWPVAIQQKQGRAGQRGDLQGTVPQPRRGQSGAPLWAEPLAGRPAAGCWLRAMHHHQPKGNGMQSREDTERPRSYNRGLQSWQQSTCSPQTNAEGRRCVISGSDEVMGSGDLCAESRAYVQAHFYVQSRCGDKCGKGRGKRDTTFCFQSQCNQHTGQGNRVLT